VAGFVAGRRAYRAVDAFTAISTHSAATHRRDPLLARVRMEAIPNFVPDELLERMVGPPLPDLPNEYLLFVGALGRHKGIHVLLDAYRRLGSTVPLVLIGPARPETPRVFPPNVIARPGLAHADVIRAMDHARFLVAPSVWDEPFGLVLIEAMARRKAVVASRVGALPEIVRDGETGLLVAPGEAQALAEAMRVLLDDRERAERMGRAGGTRCAAHYGAHTVVGRVEALYREARAALGCTGEGSRWP
jgi:glycosyltransferase involved in cell wall biosynthesis